MKLSSYEYWRCRADAPTSEADFIRSALKVCEIRLLEMGYGPMPMVEIHPLFDQIRILERALIGSLMIPREFLEETGEEK